MYLKELHIRNFKSIKEADITLPPMALVVGANAAGKSNLVSVFRFIADMLTRGIDEAIALQGGLEWMANVSLPKGTPIEIGFTIDISNGNALEELDKINETEMFAVNVTGFHYSFRIKPYKRGKGYKIENEMLSCSMQRGVIKKGEGIAYSFETGEEARVSIKPTKSGTIQIYADNHTLGDAVLHERSFENTILDKDIIERMRIFTGIRNSSMLLTLVIIILKQFSSPEPVIRIYDFDPQKLKGPFPVASPLSLDSDGGNLAPVLKRLLNDKQNARRIDALLRDYLPFATDLGVESSPDKTLRYTVRESYSGRAFPQEFLSDGTASIVAILTSLYFQKKTRIVVLEEPERNLHPRLLAKLLASAEDVSTEKQVILTTHNPEFLKHANIEHVLLVSRDKDGFTTFTFPKDSENVRSFLENDLGLDDLFLQNMLGV